METPTTFENLLTTEYYCTTRMKTTLQNSSNSQCAVFKTPALWRGSLFVFVSARTLVIIYDLTWVFPDLKIFIEIRKPRSKRFLVVTWYRPPDSSVKILHLFWIAYIGISDHSLIYAYRKLSIDIHPRGAILHLSMVNLRTLIHPIL